MIREGSRQTKSHDALRVLTIRGKSFCNSACVFCVEKFTRHPHSPTVDETRRLILEGTGKYNMLFFMNGEPSLHPKLFEHVELGKERGYRYFGMSSHFRAFADPAFALRILDAGFEFFDISLHAATFEGQEEVNPIGDGGRSLSEALHGLRNILELARRLGRHVGVTHKITITKLNYESLLPLFRVTYRFGVRNYILQPVKVSGLELALAARLEIGEDEFMPHVNELLRQTEGSGAEIKLFGMSQLGAYPSQDLVQETNVIKHVNGKGKERAHLRLFGADRLVPRELPFSTAAAHSVTVRSPATDETWTFECKEDQLILNAALASGLTLPFGCRMGSCGLCCGRIVEGSVDHGTQLVLRDDQMQQGFVLLCKAMPRSALVVVTHQEPELGL
jgi:ferredoxin